MEGLKKLAVVVCMALFVFTACGEKKEEPKAGAAPAAAAGKPAPEFLAAKLKCMKDATIAEDMEIPVKSLLEGLDRGDWKPVTLDAKTAEKYSVAWEYVMEQGGGKSVNYLFGQSKTAPGEVVLYLGTEVSGGVAKPTDVQLVFAKIKAQAEQMKSSK